MPVVYWRKRNRSPHDFGQCSNGFVYGATVIKLAGLMHNLFFQPDDIQRVQRGRNARLAKVKFFALVEHEINKERFAIAGQFGIGGNDTEIGKTFRQIMLAQQFAIIGDAVGVVIIVG